MDEGTDFDGAHEGTNEPDQDVLSRGDTDGRRAALDEAIDHLIDPFRDERPLSDETAAELFEALYDTLRAMAAKRMSKQRGNHTLQATALVHDAYIRLAETEQRFNSRSHFLCAVALTMRRLLMDHEERRRAKKRTRPDTGPIEGDYVIEIEPGVQASVMDFEALLREFQAKGDDFAWKFLFLKFHGGASIEEIADVLDMSKRTVERRWEGLSGWLRDRFAAG